VNRITEQILQLLRDSGNHVSGARIAEHLEISRTAVWKHINQLRAAGYEIASVSNRGYCLVQAPEMPLDLEIRAHLHTRMLGRELVYLPTTASTNSVASELAEQGAVEGTVVIADAQEQGRGRLQRNWHSPAGRNIYLSAILRPTVMPYQVPQLSLVTGVAVARMIERQVPGLAVAVKWPNDVFIRGRKVCGILCDMRSEIDRVHHLVLGIGINVNLQREELPAEIAERATSLQIEANAGSEDAVQVSLNRAELVAALLEELETAYQDWQRDGLASIKQDWDRLSFLKGRTITVETPAGEVTGEAAGLSDSGFLTMKLPDGSQQQILSGDVHVAAY
jgi:BirA family biotin operon repressor/biotin-[acetyl-CoA-carboxylase] ligase